MHVRSSTDCGESPQKSNRTGMHAIAAQLQQHRTDFHESNNFFLFWAQVISLIRSGDGLQIFSVGDIYSFGGWHEEMTVRGIDFGMAGRLQLRIAGLVAAASAKLREGEASR